MPRNSSIFFFLGFSVQSIQYISTRNAKAFRGVVEPMKVVFRRCADDLLLWSHRCNKQVHKDSVLGWAAVFAQLAL
jgi:hypothetical protein